MVRVKHCFTCKYRDLSEYVPPCIFCISRALWTPRNDDQTVTENDPLNPKHYTDGKIEVIDFIEDKKLGFCLGNAIKYISRAGKKDPTKEVEDLRKAIWYLERRIKELEEVSEND